MKKESFFAGMCIVKKSAVIVLAVFFLIMILSGSSIEYFKEEAGKINSALKEKSRQYEKIEKKYEAVKKKISEMKSAGGRNPVMKFINGILLGFYLKKGNKLGYEKYIMETELSALKEDKFVMVSVILQEFDKKVYNCAAEKCGDMKKIYTERSKWSREIYETGTVFDVSAEIRTGAGGSVREAEYDMIYYLEKKAMQAKQRIYILKEEKKVLDVFKQFGVETDKKNRRAIEEKCTELEKLYEKIKGKLKKIKTKDNYAVRT
ncbi:MAG: hypothetical protein ACLFP1_01200 [Candidatus Goldiibacteriota bacterium]